MVDTTVVQSIRQYLHTLKKYGIFVQYGVLFGSFARNQPHAWSDIDLAVVSEQFDDQPRREDVALLWKVAARIDSRIEPIAVGKRQFENGSDSAIVEIARREGQIITLEPLDVIIRQLQEDARGEHLLEVLLAEQARDRDLEEAQLRNRKFM